MPVCPVLNLKRLRRWLVCAGLGLALDCVLNCSPGLAQWMPPAQGSVFSVQATQPLAYEPGNHAAVFTISRSGTNNAAATISYTLSGSATNGVDYASVPTSVTLAAGQSATNITITPLAETDATGFKTVVLELPRTNGWFFPAGRGAGTATVYIAYNYTNVAPTVAVASPTNGASFLSRPNIVLLARAGDSNGWVTSVEFLANGTSLATVTNQPFLFGPLRPWADSGLPPILRTPRNNSFMVLWTNVPPGTYALTAVATDNAGLQTTSLPVNITVTTKLPEPAVRIVAPMSGASFPSNADINLIAAAGEVGGAIATVEFLAEGKSLGVVTNNPVEAGLDPMFAAGGTNIPWRPFFFLWTNAPVGSNTVTALATDNNGSQVLSAPVTIEVLTNSYRVRRWR